MNKAILTSLMLASMAAAHSGEGQTASLYATAVDLNIGNIAAPHLIHGDMWWNPATGTSPMQFPKGVTGQLGGVGGIYSVGRNISGATVGAMQMYRSNGADFWPGPIGIVSSDEVNNQLTEDWAKIWRIDRTTIDAFLLLPTHTISNTPAAILEWPGKGNPHARGRNGAALSVPMEMAPFADLNANGVYEPLSGEYPRIKGDQMLWWVINDQSRLPNAKSSPIGQEIRISAYAYSTGTLTDNVIFYEYDLLNNSTHDVRDFVFAPVTDLDINNAFNDYTGFDSARRVAVTYDQSPLPGARQQIGGLVLLEQPGDSWQQYVPAGAMNFIRNEPASPNSDPENSEEAYLFMTGYDRLGNKRMPNSNYAISSLDAQCQANALAGDQRMLLATAPVELKSGASVRYAFALVAADSAGACPNTSFTHFLSTVDSAYSVYYHPKLVTPPVSTGIPGLRMNQLAIYPNPAEHVVNLKSPVATSATIRLRNVLGAAIRVPIKRSNDMLELDVSTLPGGMYYIDIVDGDQRSGGKFVKN